MTDYERWIVFDENGVIFEGPDEDEAREEFARITMWSGDLRLAKVVAVKR